MNSICTCYSRSRVNEHFQIFEEYISCHVLRHEQTVYSVFISRSTPVVVQESVSLFGKYVFVQRMNINTAVKPACLIQLRSLLVFFDRNNAINL